MVCWQFPPTSPLISNSISQAAYQTPVSQRYQTLQQMGGGGEGKLCPFMNNIDYNIQDSFSCTSTNVIYLITCLWCPSSVYIGEMGLSL